MTTTLDLDYALGDIVKIEDHDGLEAFGYIIEVEYADAFSDNSYLVSIKDNPEERIWCSRYDFL